MAHSEHDTAGAAFVLASRRFISDEYVPKIAACMERLTTEQVWWRPNNESNAVGNLLLHLEGNLRQWIVSGIGGQPDTRKRQAEFDATSGAPDILFARLGHTTVEADRVLAQLDPESLSKDLVIQGLETTVLGAIYHVVEHFAMHTGQIVYTTKMLTGADLQFYTVANGIARQNWSKT